MAILISITVLGASKGPVVDQEQNKSLLLTFPFCPVLNKAYPNLDFETKIVQSR